MPIKPVECYRTSDGKIHDSREKAEQHEAALSLGKTVDKYLATLKDDDDKPLSQRARSRQRNVIIGWEQWRREQEESSKKPPGPPDPPRPVPPRVA